MFDLVADIERYPEFLPLCLALTIRSRKTRGQCEIVTADMTAGYKKIRETFTSQAILDREKLQIDVSYIDGPFRYLENRWTFVDDGAQACNVGFFIDYEFKSRALGLLMGAMFDKAFARFTSAFEQRADQLFGRH
jgi:coenzyme Q-binding protein COQ10